MPTLHGAGETIALVRNVVTACCLTPYSSQQMLNSLSVFHIVSNCLELKAEERTPHTRNWNIQADGYLSQRPAALAQFGDSFYIDNRARTTNALTHCPGMCHPSSNSLRNQFPFELSNRANNVK